MIVGTRASAWRRVGWRTGNEEMKVEEMKREKQKDSSERGAAQRNNKYTTRNTSSRPPIAGCARPDDDTI